jgi:hypothetical protein
VRADRDPLGRDAQGATRAPFRARFTTWRIEGWLSLGFNTRSIKRSNAPLKAIARLRRSIRDAAHIGGLACLNESTREVNGRRARRAIAPEAEMDERLGSMLAE